MTKSNEVHALRWIGAVWNSLRRSSAAFVRVAYDKPWLREAGR